jgi:uncharacterized phiE125 gp8 family phage protein
MTFLPRRVVAPSALPVDVSEVKLNLNISTSSQDATLSALIDAVTSILDGYSGYLGRAIVSQTWQQDFEGWPEDREFELPFPDCTNIVVTYRGLDNQTYTLSAASLYDPREEDEGTTVNIVNTAILPMLSYGPAPVTVQFVTGWNISDVPEAIRQAIITEVCAIYNQMTRDVTIRSESVYNVGSRTYDNSSAMTGTRTLTSPATERLLLKYKIIQA